MRLLRLARLKCREIALEAKCLRGAVLVAESQAQLDRDRLKHAESLLALKRTRREIDMLDKPQTLIEQAIERSRT